MSLEELVSTPVPVRSTTLPSLQVTQGSDAVAMPVPKGIKNTKHPPIFVVYAIIIPSSCSHTLRCHVELWRLVDVLWTGDAMREKGLFDGVVDGAGESDADRKELEEVCFS